MKFCKMKLNSRIIFVMLFLSIISSGIAQKSQRILMYAEQYNPDQIAFEKANNLQNVFVVYQGYFVNPKTSKLDSNIFKKYIDSLIIDKNAVGFAVLDWEGEPFSILKGVKSVSDSKYNSTINDYLEALNYAKFLRPKMKWSFYNFIPNQYPDTTGSQRIFVEKMMPLLKNLDFLTTSLYLFDIRTDETESKILRYLNSNISRSLQLAHELNVPFYPFVWHRYRDTKNVNSKISLSDFRFYVNQILTFTNNNRSVNGIIWWNSASYIYRMRNSNPNYEEEYRNIQDPKKYQKDMFISYLNVIKDLPKLDNK